MHPTLPFHSDLRSSTKATLTLAIETKFEKGSSGVMNSTSGAAI